MQNIYNIWGCSHLPIWVRSASVRPESAVSCGLPSWSGRPKHLLKEWSRTWGKCCLVIGVAHVRDASGVIMELVVRSRTMMKPSISRLKMVLKWLCAAGLQASIKKWEFHVTRTRYLEFIFTTDGIEVDPEKMQVIHDWKVPSTVRGIQSFLGFCNFYQRFIKDYSRVAHPLDRLTQKETPFEWNENCQKSERLSRVEATINQCTCTLSLSAWTWDSTGNWYLWWSGCRNTHSAPWGWVASNSLVALFCQYTYLSCVMWSGKWLRAGYGAPKMPPDK